MSQEPITLFSRIADPAKVAELLRRLVPDQVEIVGPDHAWSQAVVTFEDDDGNPFTLTLNHDPGYYSEPNWSRQMNGMRGYFSRFPESDRKQRVLMLTTTFKFSLGIQFEPDYDPEGDPRLSLVCEVAEALDGVLFTPSALRDAKGAVLLSSLGEEDEDPDAKWPRVLAEVSIDSPEGQVLDEAGRPSDVDDFEIDAEPPSPERIAARALALTAVTARAILEQDAAVPEAKKTYNDLLAWVKDIGIDDEFEEDEREAVHRPLGKLGDRMQIDTTWRLEGLAVLAWALGKIEMPPHDQLVDFNAMWKTLGLLNESRARETLAHPTLRDRDEIFAIRKRLFALHWRLRDYHINGTTMDFPAFARKASFGPLDITGLPIVKGDLAIGGQRIDEADDDLMASTQSATHERHLAANWLCVGPEIYSEASVAT